MKTAEEVAAEIYQFLLKPRNSIGIHDPTVYIAQALTAFSEERVKEADELNRREIEVARRIVDGVKEVNDHILDVAKEARAEGFEQGLQQAYQGFDQKLGMKQARVKALEEALAEFADRTMYNGAKVKEKILDLKDKP